MREARKRAGFRSVEALAEVLKVHPNTVAGLERGEHWISPELLPKLAEHLKIPPAALFPGYAPDAVSTEVATSLLRLKIIGALAELDERQLRGILTTISGFSVKTAQGGVDLSKKNNGLGK